MTREEREEAIELLEKEKAYMLGHGGDTQANALNMVIQALEQQNELFKMGLLKDCESCKAQSINFMCCDDVINREKAKLFLYERLDRLNNDELYDIFSTIIDDMYNELPSVTPTQRWIHVSEGLPERNGVYIVSYEDSVRLLEWFNGKWFFYPSNPAREETGTVIAWQSLPQPYKAESEE